MEIIQNNFLNKLIFNKYKIIKAIGRGSHSLIFLDNNIINQQLVAVKIQEKLHHVENIEKEAYYLLQLKGIGIPKLYSFGHYGKYKILVEELLGKTIDEIFNKNKNNNKNIILKDMILAGIQLIERIKYIHSKYILHLDIKPSNFLVGNQDSSTIYVIDFGFAKKYRSSRTGKHIQLSKKKYFFGNLKFSSIRTMKGFEPSRRDDLESLGYLLIHLFKQQLPWDNINSQNIKELNKKLYEIKCHISIDNLCKDLPNEMKEYMKYVKSLKFEEEPNYNYLKNLFEFVLKKINNTNIFYFSWGNKKIYLNKNESFTKNSRYKKTSPFSRILKDLYNSNSESKEIINNRLSSNNLGTISDIKNKETILNNSNKVINIYKKKDMNNIKTFVKKNNKILNLKNNIESYNNNEFIEKVSFPKNYSEFPDDNIMEKNDISKININNDSKFIKSQKNYYKKDKLYQKNFENNKKRIIFDIQHNYNKINITPKDSFQPIPTLNTDRNILGNINKNMIKLDSFNMSNKKDNIKYFQSYNNYKNDILLTNNYNKINYNSENKSHQNYKNEIINENTLIPKIKENEYLINNYYLENINNKNI